MSFRSFLAAVIDSLVGLGQLFSFKRAIALADKRTTV